MAKKLSEIQRTASFAWSPGQQTPLIAAGTAAGALDDSFSNASELELFQLDLSSSKSDGLQVQHGLSPVGKINSSSRFNKLAWGYNTTEKPYGILAGGMENGELFLWDPSAILNNKGEESLILRNSTHSGAIRGLDFNLHQSNLLASAGSNSQVYIWDLVNPDKPFTPGSRSMNMDDITNVGWNGQVSHILATTSNSGHTVVWDLRNKKEVMTLTYSGQNMGGISAGNRRGITTLAWHPDVATQLVTGAEDDNNPIITLWDLRHAHSPEKVLTGHQKGILSVSWCRQDADLLLSCGKDSRTLCWNPQSGELLGQVSQNSNWTFQADWCPRNPDLFATASFDGQVNVFSLQGAGDSQVPENQSKPTQADDPFSAAMLSAVPQTPSFALKHPPKWLRRPVGASFSFGGKLVTFNNKAGQAAAQAAAALPPGTTPALQNIPRNVSVISVVSDPEIAKQSDELEAALEYKNLQQLIDERRSQSIDNKNTDEQESWEILRTLYDENARSQLLKHLGFSKDDVITTVNKLAVGKTTVSNGTSTTTDPSTTADNNNNVNELQGSGFDSNKSGVSDLFGNGTDNDFFIKSPGQSQQLNETVTTTLLPPVNQKPLELYPSTSSEMDRLITRAVVLGDFESAVNACLASERWSDALMFAICGGEDLLARTRLIYFEKQASSNSYLRLLESVINSDLLSVVRNTELKEWDSIIAVLCTFARSEDFGTLSETLGARLEDAWATSKDINKGREYRRQATFCYLAAGNLEKVTGIWIVEQEEEEKLENDKNRGSSLQHLVEKVTVFRNAIGYEDIYLNDNTITHFPLGPLYHKYCQYAELLATQGKLVTALKYLSLTPSTYQPSTNTFNSLPIIRDRIYRACGQKRGANQYPEPAFPFEMTQVVAEYSQTAFSGATQQQQQQQQQQQHSYATTNNNAYQPYSSNQPTTLSSNNYAPVANPLSVGNNVYQPQTSNQYGTNQPQASYGGNYNQPSVGYNNNAYGANAYGNTYNVYDQPQQSSTVPPPPPMAGPPRQGSAISSPSRSGTPKLKNTSGAWNDPPMLPNPNITKSPRVSAAAAGATKRVTSPFPNAPPSAAFVPPPQQQFMQAGLPQGNMGMIPPPPQQNTMVPPPPQQQQASIPPPPMNAMAPTPLAKQPPPPPPTQQQLQQQQQQQQLSQGLYNPPSHGFNASPTPPPPMNAPPQQSPNMARPPPPQQNQYTPSPMGNSNNNYAPNPYAPSPQQQHQQPQSFSQPPPSHHQRPPPPQQSFQQQQQQPFSPQQNFHQPPPHHAQQQQFHPQQQQQALSQPPMNVNSSSSAPVAAKPAAPAIPEKQRHPKDDRSHIPPQQRPIFEILSGELQNQRQRSSPAQKKILDDTEKRLNGLFDNMNNSELSDDVVQSMLKLAQAVQTRDYNQAHRLQVELVTTRYAECGAWLVGVKRLIENAQKQNM